MFFRKSLFFFVFLYSLASIPAFSGIKEKNVEVGFSPGKSAIYLVLKVIKQSKININVAAYSFTSKPISQALLEAKKRGVLVRVVADKRSNKGRYTSVNYLANNGVLVRLNGNYSIMHNKFMIVDNYIVETGSFNYTKNAAFHNAENLVVFKEKRIAEKYNREFERLWEESEPVIKMY